MMCDLNCKNLKCIATGECVDVPAVADAPSLAPTYCSVDGAAWCEVCAEKGRCSWCPASKPIRRTVIAFTGLAGSGKSTAALHLVKNHGFERVRFAGPLKAMLAALGCTPAEIDGDRKEVPCDLLGGKTPRHAMQTLGTEWGRDLIAPDLWIRAWEAACAKVLAGKPIVVDDCRFPNEAEAIRRAGGVIVQIKRPGAGTTAAGHVSEAHHLPALTIVSNTSTETAFLAVIDTLVRDLSWANVEPA